MATGHNSNAVFSGVTYHVQTEDRLAEHPFIDTTVYSNGKVLHRRTNSYYDLLPMAPEKEAILQQRVDAQHHGVMEEIRSGALHLTPSPAPQVSAPVAAKSQSPNLQLELLNPRHWLAGGKAHLEMHVKVKATQASISGARVEAHIEGAATPAVFVAQTGPDGRATLNFPMPRLGGGEAALVLFAAHGSEHAQLRFQLRAKRKAPATSRN
jgi:hypothetical protein